ncbi:putative calcium-translocating P-type ATPase, PMCA-type [Shuttleworthella sp. MSX8B]|uniref:cation-translocating P-type ATPase n=1 Tax=Shuttleworthella sp. MSX8B TaxID=936574 RepID=UPI0004524FEB|nr:putative calcium-translocating P-type ATPase, PMCA-type [Shuttleworthia sp. MSX8B]
MAWYQRDRAETERLLESSSKGLSKEEAAKRLSEYGPNALAEAEKKSALRIFLEQFADLMVLILIVAALVSAFTGDVESMLVIVSVLVLNAVLGTIQHVKAEKSLESLKSLSSPKAKVIRGGVKMEIDSTQLVPGDMVSYEAGDMVVADGRILENFSLQVNESSLTGESVNVDKSDAVIKEELALADRINMVYSGSLVTYGRANVMVTATGMETEIGKIAGLMNDTKEKKTPLQATLDDFSGKLAAAIMVISILVFGLCMWRGMALMNSLLFAVALAVAAIPEALSSIVTIVQAMGTQKMAKEQAIIKNLAAVESLGCVSVICSDKTGTLTQNKMTVQEIYVGDRICRDRELDVSKQLHRYLLYAAVLANDSAIVDGEGIGDPTEYSLLSMYRNIQGLDLDGDKLALSDHLLRSMAARLEEIPFDSDRKLMSSKHLIHGRQTVFTKGAVDVLLDRCVFIRLEDGIYPMTEEVRGKILAQNEAFSAQGLRVLAFAYKESEEKLSRENERDFIFLGLISQMDPPREESMEAVARAKAAGIRTVMITGDHKVTATAIARAIGIFAEEDEALTGQELDALSDAELDMEIERISVYARVSPENKIRIVDAWQRKGKIVSMTGDGVNDAPALKKADIGVAMGITGTEVSKDAASMILADDNFATIIKAVANGRTVYNNIRNAVLYLLSGNLSAIIAVLYTSLLALPIPFAAVQLLFINLVTDSLPALAIGMEPSDPDVLRRKPRDPKQGILTRDFVRLLIGQGGLIAVCVIASYWLGLTGSSAENAAAASTMAFATLTLARLLHGFNCRSRHSLLQIGFAGNWYSLGAFVLGFTLVLMVLFLAPVMRLFSVVALRQNQYLEILGLALLPTLVIQLVKLIRDRRE